MKPASDFSKEIESLLRKAVESGETPAVHYMFFNEKDIIHNLHYGYKNVAGRSLVDDTTTYHAFSVTKTFTATAIMQLAELGKLDIDRPASDYLSSFPYGNRITIRNLLTHTAGIANPIPLNWIHAESDHVFFDSKKFFAEEFKKHAKVKSQPNEKFAYSNLGYVLLGQIIEEVSGLRYEQYITEHILRKLEPDKGSLRFEIPDIDKHATGYHKAFSFSNLVLGFLIDKSRFMEPATGAWKPFRKYYVNGAAYGGLIGSTHNLSMFIMELLKPQPAIISDKYRKIMFTENVTSGGKHTGMSLSWYMGNLDGKKYFTHAGGGGGYYCEIRIYPEAGYGSVIMFNRTGFTDERYLNKPDALAFKSLG